MTGGDALLACLQAQGVRAVFGMPGTQNIGLYDAFHRGGEGIAHYLIRHEQAATIMANGFARASGEVAAAFTVPGPGATNAATGILDAACDHIPLLLVVGGYDRPLAGRDRSKMFHGLEQREFFAPFTRYFGTPHSADEIPDVVEQAFRAMFADRPGPVVIEMPPDVAVEEVRRPRIPARVPRQITPAPDAAQVDAVLAQIRRMSRPVLLVGHDCVAQEACPAAQTLAECLQAPVLHTRLGSGVVSHEHPLAAGHVRTRRARELLSQADGLIAIGVRFTQIDTSNWTLVIPANTVQLDRDPRELGREMPITAGAAGSLRGSLERLSAALRREPPIRDRAWSETSAQSRNAWRTRPPAPVLSQIRQALPRDGLLSVDVTAYGYRCFDQFPVYEPRSLIYPCHSVALGFAFPAAVGAKLADRARPVVSFSGDGGFLMTCNELATAVEYEVGVVAVVARDDSLSAIKGSQRQAFAGRTVDTDMWVPDLAALSRCWGAHAEETRNMEELPGLIEAGLARRGPTVIELDLRGRGEEVIASIPWLGTEG